MLNISLTNCTRKNIVSFILVATIFSIPISISLKSIFVVLAAVGILLTPAYRQDFSYVFSQLWCKTAVTFFLLVVLACFWSSADYHTCFIFVEKYSKLLYLPLFALGFQNPKTRTWGIYSFILAMLFTCIVSICKDISVHEAYPFYDPGKVFHNHILTSYMMAFAAYLSGILAIRQHGAKRIFFILSLLLLSYQMLFINTGRAGCVLYFVLMILLLAQNLPLKYLAAGLLCFCSLFALFSYQSTVVSGHFHEVATEWQYYQHGNKETRIGWRLEMHDYAKNLFLSNPWIGHGTGGFANAVKHDHFLPDRENMLDPHSQYWLVATELGLVGLIALACFFASLFMAAFRLNEMKPIMLGLLVSFFIGNLSDSLLFYSVIGNLFILFSALCLGELIERREDCSLWKTRPIHRSLLSSE